MLNLGTTVVKHEDERELYWKNVELEVKNGGYVKHLNQDQMDDFSNCLIIIDTVQVEDKDAQLKEQAEKIARLEDQNVRLTSFLTETGKDLYKELPLSEEAKRACGNVYLEKLGSTFPELLEDANKTVQEFLSQHK